MSQYQNRKPIPRTILNEYRLSLKAPIEEKLGGTKEPGLRLSVLYNNPRIDVFTGIPNDKEYGVIKAPMDPLTFFTFLERFKEIIEGENDQTFKILNYTGMPSNKTVVSTTIAGKDKDGIVWLSVIAEGRPRIKFKVLPSNYHIFKDKDGNDLDLSKVSYYTAKGWVNQFGSLVPNVMNSFYEAPDGSGKPKQHNSSGYGNTSNPNTNYDKKSDFNAKEDLSEDDITF